MEKCAYKNCKNLATGKCSGNQSFTWNHDKYNQPFKNNCNKYFCEDHLEWGWGCCLVNCCVADKQCDKHHTGIYCCNIS